MQQHHHLRTNIACLALGVAAAISRVSVAQSTPMAAPNVAPTAAAKRDVQQISAEMAVDQALVNGLLGPLNANLKTQDARTAVAGKLTPPLRRMLDDLDEVTLQLPNMKAQTAANQLQLLCILSVLGDTQADRRLAAFTADGEGAATATAAADWLKAWYAASITSPAQQKVVDDLEQLDRAHGDSGLLTRITIAMSHEATSPEQGERLGSIVADHMSSPAAIVFKHERAAKQAAAEQDAARANKPLTLDGTLVDGKAFSTAQLKGKVVLVDFWATWCGPCVKELPRVQNAYEMWHAKGLEVVGISNDYDAAALKTFVARAQMPWPQLFDSHAASGGKFHPITAAQMIDGIPVMYLIDRKGILRTLNARMNMEEMIPKLLAEPE